MTYRIPLKTGQVFHIPFSECETWVVINKELTCRVAPAHGGSHEAWSTPTAMATRWSSIHTPEFCDQVWEAYGEWEWVSDG